jgi:hypothetical protein
MFYFSTWESKMGRGWLLKIILAEAQMTERRRRILMSGLLHGWASIVVAADLPSQDGITMLPYSQSYGQSFMAACSPVGCGAPAGNCRLAHNPAARAPGAVP